MVILRDWCKLNNRPDLIEQWDTNKNNQIGLSLDKPISSKKKAYWKCPEHIDHLYDMAIHQRINQNQNCPFCAGKRVLKGFNDLATKCNDAVIEWDYENNWDKNKEKQLTPYDVTAGSHYNAHFICSSCHEPFTMMVKSYYRGNRCKYCAHTTVRPDGSNSFAAEHPEQLEFWDYEKNDKIITKEHPNGIRPEDILPQSNLPLNWKCQFGHTWVRAAYDQIGKGCTTCNRRKKFSDSEKTVAYYVEKMFGKENVIDNYRPEWNKRQDLDIYIPSQSIAIQYDGVLHNQSRYETDLRNGLEVASHGIKLIRIREKDTPFIDDGSLEIRRNGSGVTDESLNHCIRQLLQLLSDLTGTEFNFEVNRDKDLSNIVRRSYTIELNNSISVKRPDLVPHIASNPEHPQDREALSRLPVSHNGKIWWTCPKCGRDHFLFVYAVTGKTLEKFPCGVSDNKEVIEGVNDFATTNREEMKDWDWINNSANGFFPNKMVAGSGEGPIHWICHKPECGFSWQTKHLYERTGKQAHGCPKCYDNKRNDRSRNKGAQYTVRYLELIRDNPGITAREIQNKIGTSIGSVRCKLGGMVEKEEISREKVRICKSGPESFTYTITDKGLTIINRLNNQELSELVKKDISKTVPKKGINDLSTWCVNHNRTVLLEEWSSGNPDKPEDHLASDDDIVEWKCHICSHVWNCGIFYRTSRGYDCGECYQRTKREVELLCLRIVRDNAGVTAAVLSEELERNLYFISGKLKQLVEEGKMTREKISRNFHYTITDDGLKEIDYFSKLGMDVKPYHLSNK